MFLMIQIMLPYVFYNLKFVTYLRMTKRKSRSCWISQQLIIFVSFSATTDHTTTRNISKGRSTDIGKDFADPYMYKPKTFFFTNVAG